MPTQVIDSNGKVQHISPVVDLSASMPFKPVTEAADAAIPLQSGCLPHRSVDMSGVSGVGAESAHSAVSF